MNRSIQAPKLNDSDATVTSDTVDEQRVQERTVPTHPSRPSPTSSRRVRYPVRLLAALLLIVLGVLAAFDVAAIDPTRGGYEPPYTDVVGTPIDWDGDAETTPTGMVRTGRVLDTHTDCTTGMIRIEVVGLITFDYRELSERALAVHDPASACEARGFDPRF